MGFNDRVIITIDEDTIRPRHRFSAAHELGHWTRDRGKVTFQCKSKDFVPEGSAENPETRANRFAGELLLPPKMFRARQHRLPVTFESVEHLAKSFCTSLTATAIRLVERGNLPAVLAELLTVPKRVMDLRACMVFLLTARLFGTHCPKGREGALLPSRRAAALPSEEVFGVGDPAGFIAAGGVQNPQGAAGEFFAQSRRVQLPAPQR